MKKTLPNRTKIKRKDRCYISGKIGGLPYLEATANFKEAEEVVIKEMNLVPVNPMDNGLRPSRPWIMHMVVDVWMMLWCKHVLFLANMSDSRGAMIEYRIAVWLGMDIWFADEQEQERLEQVRF